MVPLITISKSFTAGREKYMNYNVYILVNLEIAILVNYGGRILPLGNWFDVPLVSASIRQK